MTDTDSLSTLHGITSVLHPPLNSVVTFNLGHNSKKLTNNFYFTIIKWYQEIFLEKYFSNVDIILLQEVIDQTVYRLLLKTHVVYKYLYVYSNATEHNITREMQDDFAIQSYERSAAASISGKFDNEIVPVAVPQRRGDAIIISKDEEFTNVKLDKIPTLNPVFTKDGTVTAANASTINDGAAAVILMTEEKAFSLGLKPLAYISGYADAAQEPKWFTTAPALALPKALAKAGISQSDVDFFEFNEAFAVVGLANSKILGLNNDKVNVNGGAVSLGHPLGCSGVRIIVTLINILEQNNAKYGAAAICNGGGGASAIVIERFIK